MTREEKLAIAGDYVLGLLEGDTRASFEADMTADPQLRALVDRIAEQMQALDDTVEPLPVGASLWQGVEDRLGAQESQSPALPPDRRRAALTQAQRPVGRRAAGWMAMAASVVVAAGIGFAAGTALQPTPEPVVIAVLINETTDAPGAIVEAFADDSVRIVPLEAFEVPEGRILEVWTLPDPATGPVSLGTFTSPRSIRLSGPQLPAPQSGQLYEITLEPAPGSPTGRPTGPILVKGLAQPAL